MKKLFKRNWKVLLLMGLLVIFYGVLYKIYMPLLNAFGCFDDCNNIVGGYFLLHGKRLFSEIFFNHNPFMAYVSLVVQFFTHPQNLYELILRHRQTLLLFSLVFNALLFMRFGFPVLGFVLTFELTKFYLFGDRFLAEGFIVYPIIYLVGLMFLKVSKKPITIFDYIFAAICTWFIVFMREPYVPATILLFGYLVWDKKEPKMMLLPVAIFSALSLITILLHDFNEFFYNVVAVNIGLATGETTNIALTLFKAFFYPIVLLFGGEWGYFRYIIVSFNILFLVTSIFLLIKKQWKVVLYVLVVLGLLNLRVVVPGKAFYESFHLLCWYGVFLFSSFIFLKYVYKYNKKFSKVIIVLYLCILLFHIFSPQSFLQSKPDPHRELLVNYGGPMQVGMVVNSISQSTDTLFLDGFDDIIYWQAQRFSPYKYSWYTSLMPNFNKYTDERIVMFRNTPPDYYYGSCPKETISTRLLPEFVKDKYVRLYSGDRPSCLWVKKTKLSSISSEQWEKAKSYFYHLPE